MDKETAASFTEAIMTDGVIELVCGCHIEFFVATDFGKNGQCNYWALHLSAGCNRATVHRDASGTLKDPRLSHLLRKDAFLRKKYAERRRASGLLDGASNAGDLHGDLLLVLSVPHH